MARQDKGFTMMIMMTITDPSRKEGTVHKQMGDFSSWKLRESKGLGVVWKERKEN